MKMKVIIAEHVYKHAFVYFVIPSIIELVLGIVAWIVPFVIGAFLLSGLFVLFEWAEAVHINNIYKKKGW